jgi:hypothetical protein
MHTNELTFNELSAGDFIDNLWGQIDISQHEEDPRKDEEVCFKLAVWSLQCKFGKLVNKYFQQLHYGVGKTCTFEELLNFKRGLEVLNCYNPRDIENRTTDYNTITYDTILGILRNLNNIN